MSYATTYDGLKADIVRITDDTSDDVANNLDTIIAQAETQVLRDLDLEMFQERVAAGNLTQNVSAFARPSNVIKINGLWITKQTGALKWVPRRTLGYCLASFPDPTVHAESKYFADQDEGSLTFFATPDFAYPVTVYGIVRPAGLALLNQTTWLSNYAADLLLLACLVNCEQYLSNSNQVANWKGEYSQDRLPKAKLELRGLARATYELFRSSSQAGPVL
jgi:hypothetical protein